MSPSALCGCQPQAQTKVLVSVSKVCRDQGFSLALRIWKRGCAVLAWQQSAWQPGIEARVPAVTRDHLRRKVVACLSSSYKENASDAAATAETRGAAVVYWMCVSFALIERGLFLFLFSIVRKKNIFTVPERRKNMVNNRGEIII